MEIYQWTLISLIGCFILVIDFYIFNSTAKFARSEQEGQITIFSWVPAFIISLIFERISYRTYIFKELSWYSIIFAILPLTVLMFKLIYKIYCIFDREYYSDAENNLLHYIFLFFGIAVIALGNSFVCFDVLNYYLSFSKEYKYVEIANVYDKHHTGKYENYYTYHAELKKPILGMKSFKIQKKDFNKYKFGDWLSIAIYKGTLGAPFVYTKESTFVSRTVIPKSLIAESEELKEKYESKKINIDALKNGLDKDLPMNGY